MLKRRKSFVCFDEDWYLEFFALGHVLAPNSIPVRSSIMDGVIAAEGQQAARNEVERRAGLPNTIGNDRTRRDTHAVLNGQEGAGW